MPPAVIAAAGAIKGAVAAAGIMKSLAVAGTALSAIGAVTKNEKLMKIGMVAGTIGTLGTMGAFGAGAKTLGMSQAARTGASTFAATAKPTLARQALEKSVQGPLNAASGGFTGAQPGLLRSAIADTATRNVLPQATPSLLQRAGKAATTGLQKAGEVVSAGAQLIKNNPEAAQILAAGGVELANYLSGKTDAEIDLLEAQIDNTSATAQQTRQTIEDEKRRRQNLNQGYLNVNTSMRPTGLLAQNMQGAAA